MTPQQFAGAYLHTAQLVTAGTGIDAFVLLAQWANETDWGNVVVGNNLGNIRCSPTSFCQYATLDDFAAAAVATFHNGYYGGVLAAVGPEAQLAAIVASPWDAGHYGGSLQAFYSPLEVPDLTPDQSNKLDTIFAVISQLGSYPVGAAALASAQILENLGTYPVGKASLDAAAGVAALQADIAAIKADVEALKAAQPSVTIPTQISLTGSLHS